MTLVQILDWGHDHAGEIALVGSVVTPIILSVLPDGPFKTRLGNALHGLFPSWQVMTTGSSPTSQRNPQGEETKP